MRREHYQSDIVDCAECGHGGIREVPGCPCCDPAAAYSFVKYADTERGALDYWHDWQPQPSAAYPANIVCSQCGAQRLSTAWGGGYCVPSVTAWPGLFRVTARGGAEY